tara:strand:+ start:84 stop:314 length:231 start_codon:yes stop_codon:yes gene_type:complete
MYPELFGKSSGTSDGGTDSASNYQRKWGGYDELYCLAQGDLRRFDEISEMSVHKCYMYLANNVDKIKLENQQAKKR